MSKKILVIGADGFIGSHLVEHLLGRGYDVRAFVRDTPFTSFNSWGWLDTLPAQIKKELDITSGDIRDPQRVRTGMKGAATVYHLAALTSTSYSFAAPQAYVDTNIQGTLNILRAAQDLRTESLILTSTSEVYGAARYTPVDEEHPLQAQSPYAASKIAADALAMSFHHSFGLPLRIVRPFNTFGPRQPPQAFLPSLILQLLGHNQDPDTVQTLPKIRLGNLAPTRDFTYIHDTVRGFVSIAESTATLGETLNIATGQELNIADIAHHLIRHIHPHINPQTHILLDKSRLRPGHSDIDRSVGSTDKIKRLTTWRPQVTFEEGLMTTVQWFRENPDRYN
ncbi:MAG: GDP-mannose 4,6-dehydratase [Peptococcaceae bacterium]|nr:GDP-mannose 4,6-dehydratase [Peptococcaceae bacterium]